MSILTLQFGDYAHYVGSHFWNLQDELAGPAYADGSGQREARFEALYRTTESSSTPNLLLFDASGSEGLHRATRGAVGLASVHEALRQAGVAAGEEGSAASALLQRPHPFLSRLDACEEAWEEEEGGGRARARRRRWMRRSCRAGGSGSGWGGGAATR